MIRGKMSPIRIAFELALVFFACFLLCGFLIPYRSAGFLAFPFLVLTILSVVFGVSLMIARRLKED